MGHLRGTATMTKTMTKIVCYMCYMLHMWSYEKSL